MNRNEQFSKLERTMASIGKQMYLDQVGISGCSPAQNHALMVIAKHGEIGIKQLAEELRVTSGAATQHVAALEKVGLLSRNMGPSDRREVIVEITTKGRDISKKLSKAKDQVFAELFGELSDSQLETFVKLVEKVGNKYIEKKRKAV